MSKLCRNIIYTHDDDMPIVGILCSNVHILVNHPLSGEVTWVWICICRATVVAPLSLKELTAILRNTLCTCYRTYVNCVRTHMYVCVVHIMCTLTSL